jgi:hypothetical protein
MERNSVINSVRKSEEMENWKVKEEAVKFVCESKHTAVGINLPIIGQESRSNHNEMEMA